MLSMQGSRSHSPSRLYSDTHNHYPMATDVFAQNISQPRRKRKAESQDNDRLSKRLSLLNLERSGQKLYVPVESKAKPVTVEDAPPAAARQDEYMQVDDSKHKVYIYNLDDELSSSESEAEDGRLVFLPDIERHLFANRIPAAIKANPEGEYAGVNLGDMQLVLYDVPKSLTVEPDRDSVRKAILEARQRLRDKQRAELGQAGKNVQVNGVKKGNAASNGVSVHEMQPPAVIEQPYDPDAMDLS